MGEPVRIDDMARNLIRLSGYTPDVDIPIVYTGLRPGEKLYEELLMSEEGMQDTENELIHIGHPIDMDDEWFEERLGLLEELSSSESNEIKRVVAEIVPTYQYMK
jgi:FlaA1/EpsC-like NDP-sugar epimerase